jgi:lysophospholipase L1-like esterase
MATLNRTCRLALACIALATALPAATLEIPANHPSLRWEGRVSLEDSGAIDASWPTTRMVLRFRGTSVSARVDSGANWWNVTIDGLPATPLRAGPSGWKLLASDLPEGNHDLVLSKRTESLWGRARVRALRVVGATPEILAAPPENQFGIEFIGNSITCGYGVLAADPVEGFQDSSQDADATASAIAARALGAQHRAVCRSGYGVIRDAGGFPNTLPGIYDRIHPETAGPWDHSRWHPDLVVVNLGTNDFAKGIPDSTKFHNAYADFLRHLVAVHPGVSIALVHGPMIADGYPFDSLGQRIPTATKMRNHIRKLLETLRPELGVPMDSIELTPQTVEMGFGGDYHPNLAQSALNGAQIAARIRRAFPGLNPSVRTARPPLPSPTARSWNGEGRWQVEFLDLQGRVISAHEGVGAGNLEDLSPPRGIGLARIRQDSHESVVRLANP